MHSAIAYRLWTEKLHRRHSYKAVQLSIEYNYTVVLEDAEITPDMAELLSEQKLFTMSASAMQKSVNTLVGEKEILSYTIAFPEDSDFEGLINLQERKSGKELTIQPGSVIISEKLSMLTGAKAGDNITVELDDKKYTLPVSGVTENYVYHYIYMDFETYEQIYSEPAEINVVFARSAEGAGDLSSEKAAGDGRSQRIKQHRHSASQLLGLYG